jgi:hypothetical protein
MTTKKKRDPDYTLNIFHHYNEKTKQDVVVFLVQTTKIFVSFQYEILLEEKLVGNKINIRITGLHIPELLMPHTGPAQGRFDYTNLHGLYKLIVTKQDKTINEFSVQISHEQVDLIHKPRSPFIIISGDPVDLS